MYALRDSNALESVTEGLEWEGWMVALIDDSDDQMDAFCFLSFRVNQEWRVYLQQ